MTILENQELVNRLKAIKILIVDVDGVMTDGRLHFSKGGSCSRVYHVKDGYGLKVLLKSGIDVAVISASMSEDLKIRFEGLGIKDVLLGSEDKVSQYEKLKQQKSFEDSEACFIGDELFDIPLLEKVGLSVTVPHAVDAVKKRVNYVTQFEGGQGAVREVSDAIRISQQIGPYLD